MNRFIPSAAAAAVAFVCAVALLLLAAAWGAYRVWCFIRAAVETLLFGKSAEEQLAHYQDDIQEKGDDVR